MQARNVQKKNEALIPPMCDAACKLISIFNEGMCATRYIKSIILKKGGLTKVAFTEDYLPRTFVWDIILPIKCLIVLVRTLTVTC